MLKSNFADRKYIRIEFEWPPKGLIPMLMKLL